MALRGVPLFATFLSALTISNLTLTINNLNKIMEKTLQEKLKEQGTQASILLADTYEFGSLNGFTTVLGPKSRTITGELLEKIIAWHKNPDKIFLVLDFAHSAGPSVTYGKLIFSKYNWSGYDKDSSPSYWTYHASCEIQLTLNVGANAATLAWQTINTTT